MAARSGGEKKVKGGGAQVYQEELKRSGAFVAVYDTLSYTVGFLGWVSYNGERIQCLCMKNGISGSDKDALCAMSICFIKSTSLCA